MTQDADCVAIPESLWVALVEGFTPYLADDERLADAWVAVGNWLLNDGEACDHDFIDHPYICSQCSRDTYVRPAHNDGTP